MIIGRDLMKKLNMVVDFKNKNLIWDDTIVPMWIAVDDFPKPKLRRSEIKQGMKWTAETKVTREETERIDKIIDSKYKKANLDKITQSAHQLYVKEKVMLLHLLK